MDTTGRSLFRGVILEKPCYNIPKAGGVIMKALAMGEILFDIIQEEEYLGGATLNVAVHLARLGVESYVLSGLGADERGTRARNMLEAQQVRMDYLPEVAYPTGTVHVTLHKGIPSYDISENSAWDYMDVDHQEFQEILDTPWELLCCGTLAQRTENNRVLFSQIFRAGNYRHLFFDVNLRTNGYSEEVIQSTMEYTTILKISDEELSTVSRALFGRELEIPLFFQLLLEDYPVEMMILTQGAKGSTIFHEENTKGTLIPAGKVDVVDTVGAGDSFSGAFLASILNDEDPECAAKKGSLLADFVVGHHGATPEMPEDLRKRLVE